MKYIIKNIVLKFPLNVRMSIGNLYCGLIKIPTIKDRVKFIKDLYNYNKLNKQSSFKITFNTLYPCYKDWSADAGSLGTYFWQDLWAAKRIYESGIKDHYDIGSRVDGFIAHLLAANINVTLLDIRPLECDIENLFFIQTDATCLKEIEDNSVNSLSSLCALEHFGLGRYGDPIDPEACFQAFRALERVLKIGGKLYLSLPVGKEHIEFNAQRVFKAETVVKAFKSLKLIEFSSMNGYDNSIEYNIDIHKYDNDTLRGGGRFGLFIFEKVK